MSKEEKREKSPEDNNPKNQANGWAHPKTHELVRQALNVIIKQ